MKQLQSIINQEVTGNAKGCQEMQRLPRNTRDAKEWQQKLTICLLFLKSAQCSEGSFAASFAWITSVSPVANKSGRSCGAPNGAIPSHF